MYLLVDQLSRIENGNALLENNGDNRQSETRYGTDLLYVHNIAHRHFDGERNELFDLLWSQRRRDGDYLHLVVGDIRHSVDRKREHRIDTTGKQKKRGQSDEEFFRDRKADYSLKHDTK